MKEIYMKSEFDKNYHDDDVHCSYCGNEFDSFDVFYEFINTWGSLPYILCEECFEHLKDQIELIDQKDTYEIIEHYPGFDSNHVKFIEGNEKDAKLEVKKLKLRSKSMSQFYYRKVEI